MLLIDASSLFFTEIQAYASKAKEQPSMEEVRIILTGALYKIKKRLGRHADEVVLCFDGDDYWRRDVFPPYKAKRKKARDDSKFDWNQFFVHYNQYEQELRENFPIKCLRVNKAEADDIIAILALVNGATGNVALASSDTDDLQLQLIEPRIKQWSIIGKKFITPETEKYTLFEHIVRGDSGDGVPNILSPDDHFLTEGKRQKAITGAMLEKWVPHGIAGAAEFCDELMLTRFKRNRELVDFRKIPDQVVRDILKAYEEAVVPKGKLFNYFIKHKMGSILKEGAF